MADVNKDEEALDLISLKMNRLGMLEEEFEDLMVSEKEKVMEVEKVRKLKVGKKKEIDKLKKEVFIAKGSLVRLIKDEKSFWGSVLIPGDMRGEVIEDGIGGDKVRVLDDKLGKEFIIDMHKLVEIDDKEYHKYLYEDVFKRNNREYLGYREGDIVVSKVTGSIRIVGYNNFHNDLEIREGMLSRDGGYFYKTSWVPLYFVENIVGEGLAIDKKGVLLKYLLD